MPFQILFFLERLVLRTLVYECLVLSAALLYPLPAKTASPPSPPIVTFLDIAESAGLTVQNVFGGIDTKKYIIETTGSGVAIFDYDNDG